MNFIELFNTIDEDFKRKLIQIIILILSSALLSSIITESFKISYEKVFQAGKKLNPIICWIVNSISVLILSGLLSWLFFQSTDITFLIVLSFFIVITALPLSILAYDFVIKGFFTALKTLVLKIKSWKLNREIEVEHLTNILKKIKSSEINKESLSAMFKIKNDLLNNNKSEE